MSADGHDHIETLDSETNMSTELGELIREQTNLLIRKKALKDVEFWLTKQYLEIDQELQALEAREDKIREVADEVKSEIKE